MAILQILSTYQMPETYMNLKMYSSLWLREKGTIVPISHWRNGDLQRLSNLLRQSDSEPRVLTMKPPYLWTTLRRFLKHCQEFWKYLWICTLCGNARMNRGWGPRQNLCSGSFSVTYHCNLRGVIILLDLTVSICKMEMMIVMLQDYCEIWKKQHLQRIPSFY